MTQKLLNLYNYTYAFSKKEGKITTAFLQKHHLQAGEDIGFLPIGLDMPYGINHTDHLESSTVITDQNGNKVEELLYYPFGEILSDTSPTKVRYKFAGHEFDAETELIYMKARYYDPKLARFISADTIVPLPFYPQSLNRFSYTMNNPIVLRELDGHDSTAPAQFTSTSSSSNSSHFSTPTTTNPSAIGTATNNAVLPAPAVEAAGATTDNDGTKPAGGEGTGGDSKNMPQVNNQTPAAREQLNPKEPVNVAPNITNNGADVVKDSTQQQNQNNGQNNSILGSIMSWISEHGSLDVTLNAGNGIGVSGQLSISPSCISGYMGLGAGIFYGASVTGGLNFGNSSGWGGTASFSGGGGFGGTTSVTISQGGNSVNAGIGAGVGSGLTITGGYGGKICW